MQRILDTQGLWRMVHEAGSAKGLSEREIGELRAWASTKARELPFRVFTKDLGEVRPSFRAALDNAAADALAGRLHREA